jgi:prevent-host-death family protein
MAGWITAGGFVTEHHRCDYLGHDFMTLGVMMERKVSVGTLKAKLSEYLRRARAGESVVVTDRGRPVARLGPLEGEVALAGRETELARAGLIRRPTKSLDLTALASERPQDPEGRSLEMMLEERAEGW